MKNIELFVKSKILVEDYSLLPKNISTGPVYKIHNYGDINADGYECGFLYLPKGTGIKEHFHDDDVEQYLLINGQLSIKGRSYSENVCFLGESHEIEMVPMDTIIATCKVNPKFFERLNIPITAEIFHLFNHDSNSINKSKVKR